MPSGQNPGGYAGGLLSLPRTLQESAGLFRTFQDPPGLFSTLQHPPAPSSTLILHDLLTIDEKCPILGMTAGLPDARPKAAIIHHWKVLETKSGSPLTVGGSRRFR